MVEHDFYKLMQIKAYADISEVRKRYHELALIYHPDKKPISKDADEYFKILTQGYNILSDAEKKNVYDDLLKHFYAFSAKKPVVAIAKKDLSERLFQSREKKRKDIIANYIASENNLSHKKRLLISILVTFSGFMLAFNHWFINYLNPETLFAFAGFLICYTGCYFIANNIYKRDSYKSAIKIEHKKTDQRAINVFLSLFFSLPVLFYCLVTLSANLQLRYFSDYTTVQSITPQHNEVYYVYSVNNVKIKRNSSLMLTDSSFLFRQIRVKYSLLNPNISELVILP